MAISEKSFITAGLFFAGSTLTLSFGPASYGFFSALIVSGVLTGFGLQLYSVFSNGAAITPSTIPLNGSSWPYSSTDVCEDSFYSGQRPSTFTPHSDSSNYNSSNAGGSLPPSATVTSITPVCEGTVPYGATNLNSTPVYR